MAGLPLKSGADFYNLEAARLRLHNLGADPTEVGAGLIYFNTSTGLNTSQKARLYTGSAWKTIAFSEDLDVASNADFLALKDKVDTLIGDGVDMDGIIESWKEVEAFLSGMSDTKSLMDLLNGKLNTSGGTMSGNLLIGAPDNTSYRYIQFARSGNGSRINVAEGNLYVSFGNIDANGGLTATKHFSLGNNGIRYAPDGKTYYDILTSAGGTIEGNYDALTIKRNSSYASLIRFANADGVMGYLGFSNENTPAWYPSDLTTSYILLHSGNVGDYALKTDGSNAMKDGVKWEERVLNSENTPQNSGLQLFSYVDSATSPSGASIYWSTLSAVTNYVGFQISSHGSSASYMNPRFRKMADNGTWLDWKTIAFTDSDITGNAATATVAESARTLLSAENFKLFYTYPNINTWSLGYYSHHANLDFETLSFRYGSGYNTAMLINSSGNVTIGNQDYAGSDYNLWVSGETRISNNIYVSHQSLYRSYLSDDTKHTLIGISPNDEILINSGTTVPTIIRGGNVLIGATNDNGAKLQVAGNLNLTETNPSFGEGAELKFSIIDRGYVGMIKGVYDTIDWDKDNPAAGSLRFYTSNHAAPEERMRINSDGDVRIFGNLIVEGEISGGGRAEEGGTIGGDGAEKVTATIEVGLKFKEISHTLGDNVIVQVYEWNANGQTWDMVLTDVETTTNLVTVRFGNETDVPHKVVII